MAQPTSKPRRTAALSEEALVLVLNVRRRADRALSTRFPVFGPRKSGRPPIDFCAGAGARLFPLPFPCCRCSSLPPPPFCGALCPNCQVPFVCPHRRSRLACVAFRSDQCSTLFFPLIARAPPPFLVSAPARCAASPPCPSPALCAIGSTCKRDQRRGVARRKRGCCNDLERSKACKSAGAEPALGGGGGSLGAGRKDDEEGVHDARNPDEQSQQQVDEERLVCSVLVHKDLSHGSGKRGCGGRARSNGNGCGRRAPSRPAPSAAPFSTHRQGGEEDGNCGRRSGETGA